MFKLYSHDAVDFLKSMTNESVDLFITDPPYQSLEKHRNRGTTTIKPWEKKIILEN